MEEGSTPGRVEIELTARESGRRRRRHDADMIDPLTADAVPDTPRPTAVDEPQSDPQVGFAPALTLADGTSAERRRVVVTAAVAGVVALFIGWSLGRATSDDGNGAPAADVATGSTMLPPTAPKVAPDEIGATVPPVDPALLPTTTDFSPIVARTPATTPYVGWIRTTTDVADEAVDLGIQIVGLQPGGTIVELDTATGVMSSIKTDVRTDSPGSLFAGAEWILVTQPDSARARLLRGHADPVGVMLGRGWSLYWQRGTDRFWRVDEISRFGDPLHIAEVTYDGTPTGVDFESDGRYWMATADPLGGLVVVGAPGGSYRIAPEGTSRITTGDVLALSAGTALANDCGEAMETCGLIVIDRATGASTPLTPITSSASADAGAPDVEVFESPANYGFPALMTALSPDGRYSPIVVSGANQDYGVIDLTTGEFVRFGDQPESSMFWSADSRTAMYLVNGRLMAYDFDTRAAYEVAPDLFRLQDFAVRPLAP